jgi:hypothetical protein
VARGPVTLEADEDGGAVAVGGAYRDFHTIGADLAISRIGRAGPISGPLLDETIVGPVRHVLPDVPPVNKYKLASAKGE